MMNKSDEYKGESKDGVPHGQGTKTYATGEKYVGEFKNNSKLQQDKTCTFR